MRCTGFELTAPRNNNAPYRRKGCRKTTTVIISQCPRRAWWMLRSHKIGKTSVVSPTFSQSAAHSTSRPCVTDWRGEPSSQQESTLCALVCAHRVLTKFFPLEFVKNSPQCACTTIQWKRSDQNGWTSTSGTPCGRRQGDSTRRCATSEPIVRRSLVVCQDPANATSPPAESLR